MRFPPSVPIIFTPAGQPISTSEHAQWILATASLQIAQNVDEVKPIARVALLGGTRIADTERTTEAMKLFRNSPRLREETYQACLRDALAIIDGYWNIVDWFAHPTRERSEITCADARLILEA